MRSRNFGDDSSASMRALDARLEVARRPPFLVDRERAAGRRRRSPAPAIRASRQRREDLAGAGLLLASRGRPAGENALRLGVASGVLAVERPGDRTSCRCRAPLRDRSPPQQPAGAAPRSGDGAESVKPPSTIRVPALIGIRTSSASSAFMR